MRFIDVLVNKLIQLLLSIVRRFLKSPLQLTFCGEGSTEQLIAHIVRGGHKNILLVTDKPLVELGLAGRVVEALGGGSSIDTAKTVAAAATNGGIDAIMGLFKIKIAPAPLFAIPTTAGTGSEASWFAVVSDTHTHQKTGIAAPALLPKATALDASLMTGLPKSITAATGMDALTHAIETFIAPAANDEVRSLSLPAAAIIFANLREAYENGGNLVARESMAMASYYSGISLNISAVGYVHAIAHQLAELADVIGVSVAGDSVRVKAEKLVVAVRELNDALDIPVTLAALKAADIPDLVKEVAAEGRTYSVPTVLSRDQIESILNKLLA